MNYIENQLFSKTLENNQYIQSNEIFNITSLGIDYENGADICINCIDLNYQCIGLTFPLSFNLCGELGIFKTKDKSHCLCSELINSNSDELQTFINQTISGANSAIKSAQEVGGALSVIDKTQKAYLAVTAASDTSVNASYTLGEYILESTITPNTLKNLLIQFNEGILSLGLAQSSAAYLSNKQVLTTNDVTNPLDPSNSIIQHFLDSIGYMQNVSNVILNLTPPPTQEVINNINIALSILNTAASNVNALSSANPPTWYLLDTPIQNLYSASKYIQNSLYLLSESYGNASASQIITHLKYVLESINNSSLSATNLNNSLFQTDIAQLDSIYKSALLSYYSARYSIASVNISSSQTLNILRLYNKFETGISNLSCCNKRFCLTNCNKNYNSLLFYQEITSLHVCGLSICVCGTIGQKNFTAQLSRNTIISLEDLNFKPIIVNDTFCIPKNIHSFVLKEEFKPDFNLQCIYPVSKYDSLSPLTFSADIYSKLNLKTILTGTTMERLNTK